MLTLMAGMALAMAPAAAAGPPEIKEPIIVGEPLVGATLSVAAMIEGDPLPTVTYDWRRGCPAADCPQVGTDATYVVADTDAGAQLFVQVTATNRAATAVTDWLATQAVKQPPAVNSVTIAEDIGDDKVIVGERLTASAGVSGAPTPTVSYGWHRCDVASPAVCEPAGAGGEHLATAADRGHVLFVRATASNDAGTATGDSARTTLVHEPPQVISVAIAGKAVVGEKLTADATATGTPAPGLRYEWLRCAALLPLACQPIEDATAKGYVVGSADAGDRLAVRVTAANAAGEATAGSPPTDAVPHPVRFDQSAPTSTPPTGSTPPTPSSSGALRYLRPFPVVRVKGFLAPGGARVSLVRVKAPRRSKVTVRCRKFTCPVSRGRLRPGRLRALERFLPAGARIIIRVSKPGRIGKYVRVVIRDGSAPKRHDACLLPGETRPTRCPTA